MRGLPAARARRRPTSSRAAQASAASRSRAAASTSPRSAHMTLLRPGGSGHPPGGDRAGREASGRRAHPSLRCAPFDAQVGGLAARQDRAGHRRRPHSRRALLTGTMVYPRAGQAVSVHFSSPVRVTSVQTADGRQQQITLHSARRSRADRRTEGGADLAGTALVAGVPRRWEPMPTPRRISWFPARPGAERSLSGPLPKSQLVPSAPTVPQVLAPGRRGAPGHPPHVQGSRKVEGSWRAPNDTLVFQRGPAGFPSAAVSTSGFRNLSRPSPRVGPARFRMLITWQVPRGSLLRNEADARRSRYLRSRGSLWASLFGSYRRRPARAAVVAP